MKIKINRNNTNWLSYLGISSVISGFILFMGLIVFILSAVYTTGSKTDQDFVFGLNLVTFYYSLIIAAAELCSCIYFFSNYYYWVLAYRKSFGERKTFNLTFISIMGPIYVIMALDSIVRIFYVVAGLLIVSTYVGYNSNGPITLAAIDFTKDGFIFGNFSPSINALSQGNFGFNSVILIILMIASLVVLLLFYFKQNKKFISEERENSLKEVKQNYRKIDNAKLKKKFAKHKQSNISKRIKAF
ncbi:MAG: hypothetical protein K2H56_04145 [Malacoplasma sp.]|nr:hypothetical protein [Malacoplasma sp.]MDE5774884.1 hypothetical protein [Malacoplasma sp.]